MSRQCVAALASELFHAAETVTANEQQPKLVPAKRWILFTDKSEQYTNR